MKSHTMITMTFIIMSCISPLVFSETLTLINATEIESSRQWLAGDHHVHSQYSVIWDTDVDPPAPIIGAHGTYPILQNAKMAKHFGLSWMVTTDHGGQNHAKLNLDQAYPDLLLARESVPELIQFFGLELNSPGADHASIIVPHTHDEAERVYQLESRFDRYGADPADAGSNTTERMIEALLEMQTFPDKPIVIANHPSRKAIEGESYGLTTPSTLRSWNDVAPEIAVGMAGAPGRQASSVNRDGSIKPDAPRGHYWTLPTRGGFDPMTAIVGGFWDSMLGENRRWWITANSDSHKHWTDGGADFWPGEYSKTYVYANTNPSDILSALRTGRIFVTTGDLIAELYVTATIANGTATEIGGRLLAKPGDTVLVTIRIRDPEAANSHGDDPAVGRVDIIAGNINGVQADTSLGNNSSTHVAQRFSKSDWTRDGEILVMSYYFEDIRQSFYLRVRGTSTAQLEPGPDQRGEDPWVDLWFYSNPIFVAINSPTAPP